MIEVTDYGNRLFFSANTKKGSQQPNPIRIPRPYEKKEKPRVATPTELKAFMKRSKGRKK